MALSRALLTQGWKGKLLLLFNNEKNAKAYSHTMRGTRSISRSGVIMNSSSVMKPSKSQLVFWTHSMALGHLTYGLLSLPPLLEFYRIRKYLIWKILINSAHLWCFYPNQICQKHKIPVPKYPVSVINGLSVLIASICSFDRIIQAEFEAHILHLAQWSMI